MKPKQDLRLGGWRRIHVNVPGILWRCGRESSMLRTTPQTHPRMARHVVDSSLKCSALRCASSFSASPPLLNGEEVPTYRFRVFQGPLQFCVRHDAVPSAGSPQRFPECFSFPLVNEARHKSVRHQRLWSSKRNEDYQTAWRGRQSPSRLPKCWRYPQSPPTAKYLKCCIKYFWNVLFNVELSP